MFVRLPYVERNSKYERHAKMMHKMVAGLFKAFLGGSLNDNTTQNRIPKNKIWFFNNLVSPLGWSVVSAQARAVGIKLIHHYGSNSKMLELVEKNEASSLLANCHTVVYSQTNNEGTQDMLNFNMMKLNNGLESQNLSNLGDGEYIIQFQNIIKKIMVDNIKGY